MNVPNQNVTRWLNCFLSFFFYFRWASSKLHDYFTHKSATAFYSEHCTSPLLFHNCEVSQGTLNWSLKNHGFICDTISFACMREHKSPSNEMYRLD